MKKSTLASIILTILVAIFPGLMIYLKPTHYLLYIWIFPFLLGGSWIFNNVVGGFAWSKSYFMSRYNILSPKVRHQQEFDLPKQLLFEKLMEAIPIIGFEIIHSDEKNGNIFANKFNRENIYINLTEVNDKTTLNFCSASIYSGFAFNLSEERNERNYKDLMHEIEKSLII
jgi:hypothetical protein